jgi:formate dehydrogenase maturation protein FdhE
MKHTEYLNKHKDEAIKNEFLTDDIYIFYDKLFKYHENQEEKIQIKEPEEFFLGQSPVLKATKLLSIDSIRESIDDLTVLLSELQPGIDLSMYKTHVDQKSKLISDSLDFLLSGKFEELQKIADEMKTGLTEHIFIILNLFKPAAKVLREEYIKNHEEHYEKWDENYCPFCGFAPDISKINPSRDNIRQLHCGFCETEWKYTRITCTVCRSKDHETQGYYQHEDFKQYRFDFCEKCKSYIKTIMIPEHREEENINLAVENILSTFLDATAIDMGFNRP